MSSDLRCFLEIFVTEFKKWKNIIKLVDIFPAFSTWQRPFFAVYKKYCKIDYNSRIYVAQHKTLVMLDHIFYAFYFPQPMTNLNDHYNILIAKVEFSVHRSQLYKKTLLRYILLIVTIKPNQ